MDTEMATCCAQGAVGLKTKCDETKTTRQKAGVLCSADLCEVCDRKVLCMNSHHLTEACHEPAQLYQRADAF